MGFTLDSIRSKIVDDNIYSTAKGMAESNMVTLKDIKAIGRAETSMKGEISEADIFTGETVETSLTVNDGTITAHTCSACNTRFSMCVHSAATALAYYRYLYRNTAMRTSTSELMKDAIDVYVKNGIWDIMNDEYGSMSLVPKFIFFTDGTMKIGFKVKSDKKEYVIQDLVEFYNRIKNEEVYEYSKTFAVKHSVWAFDKESRELLLLLMQAVEEELVIHAEGNKGRFKDVPKIKELKFERGYIKELFSLAEGRIIEAEFKDKSKKNLKVVLGNPKLSITLKETLLGGYRIELNENIQAYVGISNLLVCIGDTLYVCDAEYTRGLKNFLPKMNYDIYKEENFTISQRDMPLFYGQMLRNLKQYVEIDDSVYSNDETKYAQLEVQIHLDMNEKGEVLCEETFVYGDFSYNPIKGGSVPSGICRDYPTEYKIKNIIESFFEETDSEEGKLLAREEGIIFRLLEEGIPVLMELGNVYVSESFKNIKILKAPKVHIGGRTSSGMLEIELDIDNFDRAELRQLLDNYRQRKKYHRLKTGEFVRIEDNSLAVISELADSLELKDAEIDRLFEDTITVPKYRALYLESIINSGSDIRFDRDKSLRQLIRNMRDSADSDHEVPETLKHILRKYQRTGYRWLRTLAQNGFGGILADDMGLGKTLQVIAFLLSYKERQDVETRRPSLIVCPASLVYNWDSEIKKFAPSLNSVIISGDAIERKRLIKGSVDKEVLITSYDSLRRDMEHYRGMEFAYQVIDEAQFIKNPSTQNAKSVKEIKADVKFALTGTPIENRLSELWSIFDYLMPGFLYSYSMFREEIENPIVKEEDRLMLVRLQNMIKPFVLRRLKSDVLQDLPEKQETVVYSKFGEDQMKVYAANVAQLKKELLDISADEFGAQRMHVLSQLMRLRQICCEPALCYENYKAGSAKLETCLELVRDAVGAGHKILLFSQFTSMLSRIAACFDEEEISYYTLTGDTPKQLRVKLAEEFNNDDTKVFLISLKAGGTGLNLTGADIVIHYDPWWNVAVQNQATDRAYRIGQKNKVNVYKLIAKDSIEEKILKLQESKEMLAESIVSDEVSKLTSLSRDELLGLLD